MFLKFQCHGLDMLCFSGLKTLIDIICDHCITLLPILVWLRMGIPIDWINFYFLLYKTH